MSAQDLRAFFARLETDPELQERARALSGLAEAERPRALCELAGAQGFEVSDDDLRAAAGEAGAAALEDETLRSVVGGISCAVGVMSFYEQAGAGPVG